MNLKSSFQLDGSDQYLKSVNSNYIEELRLSFIEDPNSVDLSWKYFFEGLSIGEESTHGPSIESSTTSLDVSLPSQDVQAELKVAEFIQFYRSRGYLRARVNPLNPNLPDQTKSWFDPASFGINKDSKKWMAARLLGLEPSSITQIVEYLESLYSKTYGCEIAHVLDLSEKAWLESRLEKQLPLQTLSSEIQKKILYQLTQSEAFERFLHTRFVAQKRFSGEGCDTLLTFLNAVIDQGSELGVQEVVIGMAHRGRLGVLRNIFEKPVQDMFREFEGNYEVDLYLGEGDVKYHMGYSHDVKTPHGSIHLSLAFNPSHLEFVNPVVEGLVRAKQDLKQDKNRSQVIPVLIHGDAAFAGQGVCYETLNASLLKGYTTGGTVHLIVDNQVGFTASPKDLKSSAESSDLAKLVGAPVFRVNADDPEAVWKVSTLAMQYRQTFKKDVFVHLVGYRKYGHNEGDEPAFTQPLMVQWIKAHPTVRELYEKLLIEKGVLTSEESKAWNEQLQGLFTQELAQAKAQKKLLSTPTLQGPIWQKIQRPSPALLKEEVATAVPDSRLKEIAKAINHLPETFHLHPKLTRFFESRWTSVQSGEGLDWGNAEALAFASLLSEGINVRISGQDAERGTFSHRHSVLYDTQNGSTLSPLMHAAQKGARYEVTNSFLSETGAMGFEYGVSLADPDRLTIWEAQFGDFANGAQVILDQFLCASESKWSRMSGLTLLLPHGMEGQGPEHSSARIERFLQLSGKDNWFICYPTLPAQLFHLLRRQVKAPYRKPLVIFSPKSGLRNPLAVSSLKNLTQGAFEEVLVDSKVDKKLIQKVILCSGKVYFDLVNARAVHQKEKEVALFCIEQLYPWPAEKIAQAIAPFAKAKQWLWVQEEPQNMGAWMHVWGYWCGALGNQKSQFSQIPLHYVGREVCASPAVGSHKVHEKEQEAILKRAFL